MLHLSIMPLDDWLWGPLTHQSDQGKHSPIVFLVSDHSSAKYTLINYMLGQQNQTDEVALMDNCFMVVAPGPADDDQVKRPLDPH